MCVGYRYLNHSIIRFGTALKSPPHSQIFKILLLIKPTLNLKLSSPKIPIQNYWYMIHWFKWQMLFLFFYGRRLIKPNTGLNPFKKMLNVFCMHNTYLFPYILSFFVYFNTLEVIIGIKLPATTNPISTKWV